MIEFYRSGIPHLSAFEEVAGKKRISLSQLLKDYAGAFR